MHHTFKEINERISKLEKGLERLQTEFLKIHPESNITVNPYVAVYRRNGTLKYLFCECGCGYELRLENGCEFTNCPNCNTAWSVDIKESPLSLTLNASNRTVFTPGSYFKQINE